MVDIQNLSFIEAKSHNIKSIVEIHNSNVRDDNGYNSHGFLLAKTTEEEILKSLSSANQYFIAVNSNDEVLGFLALSRPKISHDFLDQIVFKDNSYKDKILSDRHIYIKVIATHKKYMGKGIAQLMYQSLYQRFPHSFLSAFVVSKPISNDRSIRFHHQQGFTQIGIFQKDIFIDLQNYESILFFKEI